MSSGDILRLGLLGLLWGSNFLFIKLALEGLGPWQIVLGRLAAGALVLVVAVIARRDRWPRSLAVWVHLLVMAMIATVVPYGLVSWGEQHISSGLAGVLNATTPLFALIFGALALRGERLSAARVAGLTVGFGGVVLLVAPWRPGGLAGTVSGMVACLIAAACYALSFVYARLYLTGRGIGPLVLAAGQLLAGTAFLMLLAPFVMRDRATLTLAVGASMAVLGILGTGAAYILNYRLISDVGSIGASVVAYLLPIVAVTLGVTVLGERLTWNLFAGTATVVVGIALSRSRHVRVPGGVADRRISDKE